MRYLSLIALLLLGGCALKPGIKDPQATDSPSSAMKSASAHRAKGDWAQATRILASAAEKFPDNPRLAEALQNLREAWEQEELTRRHRILLIGARAQQEQLELWRSIREDDPGDLGVNLRLVTEGETLRHKGLALVECGDYQRERNLRLARDCLQLADELLEDHPGLQEKRAQAEKAYQAQLQRWRERRAAKEAKALRARHTKELKRAEQLLDAGEAAKARGQLENVLAADPDNVRANDLMYRARSTLNQQVDALVKLGDSLYREDHLQAAISTWETVLRLAPNHKPASDKLERARRVLEKLERLRVQQGKRAAPEVAAPPADYEEPAGTDEATQLETPPTDTRAPETPPVDTQPAAND